LVPAQVLMLGGLLLGVALRRSADDAMAQLLEFDEGVFLLLFLPIIIFESAFALQKRYFFHQVGPPLPLQAG
jgi:NhaP-type Na+/H+ or K+/H+ antiporter